MFQLLNKEGKGGEYKAGLFQRKRHSNVSKERLVSLFSLISQYVGSYRDEKHLSPPD